MIILGFTGAPGSGKDTAYLILESLLKPEWAIRRYSFADPLRDFAAQLMGLEDGHPYWDHSHKDELLPEFNYNTPRELLIDLGMLGRKYRPDIWLDKAVDSMMADAPYVAMMADAPYVAVVTDVRFPNEAAKIRDLGGFIVEIDREGRSYNTELESESGQASRFATHHIVNKGTLNSFQRAVEDLWWGLIDDRLASGTEVRP